MVISTMNKNSSSSLKQPKMITNENFTNIMCICYPYKTIDYVFCVLFQ